MTEPTAPEPSAEAKVYLIQSTRIQGRKGTVLEAQVDLPAARTMDSPLSGSGIPSAHGYGVSRCLTSKHQRRKSPSTHRESIFRSCRFGGRYMCWECHRPNQRSVSEGGSRDHDFY